MTLDTDDTIATGRTWRDLPDAPPEADVVAPVSPQSAPAAATLIDPERDTDTIPLPAGRLATPPPPPVAPADPAGERQAWPWVIALAAGVALIAVLFAWSPWSDGTGDPDAAGLITGDEPVADVAAVLLPSVVQIEQDGVFGAVGSGFVYENGRVLTAAHVVSGAERVAVRTSDGTEVIGTVLGGDSVADIAVVAINADVPPAALALGETPQVGQLAVAIGSPLGFEQSVSSGIVSAVDRELPIGNVVLDGLIQTDAPINQGNSGGPLADRDGRVIGVNVAIATTSGGSDGLGFAVGIDKAVEIANRFTTANPQPETVDGGGPLAPGLLPPEFEDFLDDLLGGGGSGELPFLGDDDLTNLLDDLLGENGDLDGLFDDFFGGQGGTDGVQPNLLDYLLDLLLQGGELLVPEDLNQLFDFFQGEG
jgi:hypothetical protein